MLAIQNAKTREMSELANKLINNSKSKVAETNVENNKETNTQETT